MPTQPGHPHDRPQRARAGRIATRLAALTRRAGSELYRRVRDPRRINPFYVFAAGLVVLLPIWLLFLNT